MTPFSLIGFVSVVLGFATFLIGSLLGLLNAIFLRSEYLRQVNEHVVWYSAAPVAAGLIAFAIDLRKVAQKRSVRQFQNSPVQHVSMTVVLTAYNDELSIALAVQDFLAHPSVARVVVVSNNSTDGTERAARGAGAIVFNETTQGYGACVRRCLIEASKYSDTNVVVLCEGDMTFRAYDIDKLLSYLPHGDIINGTRIVDTLQKSNTQVTTFMHYGNLAVAKLLELKYFGSATLTDVGTTYKLMRSETASALVADATESINLEFNPYLMEIALRKGMIYIEVPITFHPRIGESKGGNSSDLVAVKVGLRMAIGILLGWRSIRVK